MKVYELGIKDLDMVEKEWRRMQVGRDMTPFQSFEWNQLLIEQFKKARLRRVYRRVRYICVEDEGGYLQFIAPLRIKNIKMGNRKKKEIEFLGVDSFSDYVNCIYNELTPEIITSFFDYLKSHYCDYVIYFKDIPLKSQFGQVVKELYGSTEEYDRTVVVAISDKKDEFMKSLSKKVRQNYRTSHNRLEKNKLNIKWDVFGKISNKELVESLMKINFTRSYDKNSESKLKQFFEMIYYYFNKSYNSFVGKSIRSMENSWLFIVKIDEKIAGFMYGLKEKNVIYVMMNRLNPEYSFYSPMMIAIIDYMQELIDNDEGIDYIDFGRGTEEYKYKLGGKDVLLTDYSCVITDIE